MANIGNSLRYLLSNPRIKAGALSKSVRYSCGQAIYIEPLSRARSAFVNILENGPSSPVFDR